MKRILVTYAGGALGIGFTRSLKQAPEPFYVVGVDSHPYMLQRSTADEKHLAPRAGDPDYIPMLNHLIRELGIDMVCPQLPQEVVAVSAARDQIPALHYLPTHETIAICEDKMASQQYWEAAGLPVPRSMPVTSPEDLRRAFAELGPGLWIRATSGTGGKDALPVHDFETARQWIELKKGWGRFMAAELLEAHSTTWESLWEDGEVLIAQGRRRVYWEFSGVSPSGVTGVTGAGVTVSDPIVDKTAIAAIRAIDPRPHGIFSVDMTYDQHGVPKLTEINCGRFFTTHQFFTAAGVNFPYVYVKTAFGEQVELPEQRINPLRPGLAWVRGMDHEPVLTTVEQIEQPAHEMERRRAALGARDAMASGASRRQAA